MSATTSDSDDAERKQSDDEYDEVDRLLESVTEEDVRKFMNGLPATNPLWEESVKSIGPLLRKRHGGAFRLKWDNEKGRTLESTRRVQAGTKILVDRALTIVCTPAPEEGNLLWDRLVATCEEKDLHTGPLWYWAALNVACPEIIPPSPRGTEPSKAPIVQQMSASGSLPEVDEEMPGSGSALHFLRPCGDVVKRRIALLFRPEVDEPSFGVMTVLHALGLSTELNPLEVEEHLQTFFQNAFQSTSGMGDPALGLWFTPSFLSHSCVPNATWQTGEDGIFVLSARQSILPGDELTISYISDDDLLLSQSHRREILAKSKQFICDCPRCSSNDALVPCTCYICGEILLFADLGEKLRSQNCCNRLRAQAVVNTYLITHMTFCALSGGAA